jgi:hypothetical protein
LGLGACSPDLNWREIKNTDQGFTVMLPDKPATMERKILLLDQQVAMTMTGAKARDISFTVAVVKIAKDDEAKATALLEAMRVQMVRNIAGQPGETKAVLLGITDAVGNVIGQAPAQVISANGRHPNGQTQQMFALFSQYQGRLLQAVVLGQTIDPDVVPVFFESLRWLAPVPAAR